MPVAPGKMPPPTPPFVNVSRAIQGYLPNGPSDLGGNRLGVPVVECHDASCVGPETGHRSSYHAPPWGLFRRPTLYRVPIQALHALWNRMDEYRWFVLAGGSSAFGRIPQSARWLGESVSGGDAHSREQDHRHLQILGRVCDVPSDIPYFSTLPLFLIPVRLIRAWVEGTEADSAGRSGEIPSGHASVRKCL